MQNLKLEELSEKHIPDVVKLEKELFNRPYSERTLRKELELRFSFGFVAEKNGEFAGYCLFWIVGDSCEIHRIGVKRALQGKGIGKLLLKKTLEFCREKGVSEILLEVSEKNERAISLYGTFGFKDFNRREKYYGNEGALLMKLNVGGKNA
jgi:ribosomal-protein-alanine N-acetyltransferase